MPRSQLFLLSPFKLFPLVRALMICRSLLFSSPRKEPRPSQRSRPPRLAPVLFLFWWCSLFFLSLLLLLFFFFLNTRIIIMRFTLWMEFPFFFLCYAFIIIVIIISMDLMCKNDCICAMLAIEPWNPNSEVPSMYLGYVCNPCKIKPLISLISSKVLVWGSTPTSLILILLRILK